MYNCVKLKLTCVQKLYLHPETTYFQILRATNLLFVLNYCLLDSP